MTLRDEVAGELADYLAAAGLDDPWSTRRDASTRWRYSSDGVTYAIDRTRFHRELVDAELAIPSHDLEGRTATIIATAGPPGAGKSTALQAFPEAIGFRSVDADSVKDSLLLRARDDGLLTPWLSHVIESDGGPVRLRELAAYVHAESTVVAGLLRRAALQEGEDVVVHGTLSSGEGVRELLQDLVRYRYRAIRIVDVEVSEEVAEERVLARWWTGRIRQDAWGERFLPASAMHRYWDDSRRSVTALQAVRLRDEALALGFAVDLQQL